MSPLLFLSHSGNDSEAAVALARRIEQSPEAQKHGLRVWIDKLHLGAGRWKDQLEHALKKSTAFAVYVGSRGVVNWVRDEVGVALDKAHADGAYPLVPILARGATPEQLPGFLAQYQGVIDVEHHGEAFGSLLRAVLRLDPRTRVDAEREPFVGLSAFDSSKTHLFFGREKEVGELVDLLRTESLVMVTGDSGSGKSSLVKAGLVPAFKGGCFARDRADGPDETVWHVIETRPEGDPFGRLADAVLLRAQRTGKSPEDASALAKLIRTKDSEDVRNAILMSTASPDGRQNKILLIVDQFEEFRTSPYADAFVSSLLRLAVPGDDRIRVLLTMRRDYYYACSSFPALYVRLESNERRARYLLSRMSLQGLRDCIVKPLALAGVSEEAREILASAVLKDVSGGPGELALLEMALSRTWSVRHQHGGNLLSSYIAIGRVEGALAQAAEEVYGGLSGDEQANAERLFIRLVRPGEAGGATRRIASLCEFDEPTQALARKLGSQEQNRLVSLSEETVEITHEQLATQWVRCQSWMNNQPGDPRGDDLRLLQRLISDTGQWQNASIEDKDHRIATGFYFNAYDELEGRWPRWLSTSERAFIAESRRAFGREQEEKARALVMAQKLAEESQARADAEAARASEEASRRTDSEVAAKKFRRQSLAASLIAAFALLAGLSAVGLFFKARASAITAEATGLWSPIELRGLPTAGGVRALRNLAVADDKVKLVFLDQLLASEELAQRFHSHRQPIATALVGLDQKRRRWVMVRLLEGYRNSGPEALLARGELALELEASEGYEVVLAAIENPSSENPWFLLSKSESALPKSEWVPGEAGP